MALQRKGCCVSVVTLRWDSKLATFERRDGIAVYRLPLIELPKCIDRSYVFYMKNLLSSFCKLRGVIDKIAPDVINIHYVVHTGIGAKFWADRRGIPAVLTLVGWDIYDPFISLPWGLRPLVNKVIARSSHIVASSSFIREIVKSRFDTREGAIEVIGYGVDIERFNPSVDGSSIRRKYGVTGEEILVLSVQRLVGRKGVEYMLRAAALVVRENKNVKFMIVGEGPERDSLVRLARQLKLGDKVIFTGKVKEAEKHLYYSAANIFALHTIHEGLGIVLLEAIASGLPVVTCRAGGTTDIVSDNLNGILVPSMDPAALSSALQKLAADEISRKKLGEAGRRIAEESYTWDLIADRYMKIFSNVMV